MWGRRGASTQLADPARDQSEATGIVLVAAVEQQLEADADTQQRHRGIPQRFDESGTLQIGEGDRGAPDPGQDDPGCARKASRFVDHHRFGPDRGQTLGDRHQVPCAVVHDGDAGHVEPLVEGMPSRRGSVATAARSARARALKAASAT